ncbi:hypothetical protein [Yersinia alsatica]|nr:hypothetical protein [Yersinia alsatica]
MRLSIGVTPCAPKKFPLFRDSPLVAARALSPNGATIYQENNHGMY